MNVIVDEAEGTIQSDPEGPLGGGILFQYLDLDEALFLFHEIFERDTYAPAPEGTGLRTRGKGEEARPVKALPITIVDAGANIGLFALAQVHQLLRRRGAGGGGEGGGARSEKRQRRGPIEVALVCIEPVPPILETLRTNLTLLEEACTPDVQIVHKAVHGCALTSPQKARGGDASSTTITYYPGAPGESTTRPQERRDTLTSISEALRDRRALVEAESDKLEDETRALLTTLLDTVGEQADAQMAEYGQTKRDEGVDGEGGAKSMTPHRTFTVPRRTLTSVLHEVMPPLEVVHVLKVDVEGDELDVLEGIDGTLWPKILNLFVEVSNLDGQRLDRVVSLVSGHFPQHQVTVKSQEADVFKHQVEAEAAGGGRSGGVDAEDCMTFVPREAQLYIVHAWRTKGGVGQGV